MRRAAPPNRSAGTIARWSAGAAVTVLVLAGFTARDRLEEAWHLLRLDAADLTGRFRAAERLGELRSARAIPGIIDLLRTHPSELVAASAVWGPGTSSGPALARVLGGIGPPAVLSIAQALEESRGQRTRWRRHACEALGLSMSEAAVSPLVAALEDPDACVRVTAFGALGSMGARAREAVLAIRSHLESRERFIRAAAGEALRSIQSAADTLSSGRPVGLDRSPGAHSFHPPQEAQDFAAGTSFTPQLGQ